MSARPIASGWIAVAVAGLGVWNVLADRLTDGARIPLACVAVAGLLIVARRAGLDWAHVGLAREHLGRGARLGGVSAAAVAVGVLLVIAIPASRAIFADDRFLGMGTQQVLYEVLVRIPIAVAIAEELAFRGVLLGMLDTRTTRTRAIWLSSAAFGLWHVLPALAALETTSVIGPEPSAVVDVVLVAGQVAVTGLAGVIFAWLRLRGRHVVAPMLAHGALNAGAFSAGWLVVQNGWA